MSPGNQCNIQHINGYLLLKYFRNHFTEHFTKIYADYRKEKQDDYFKYGMQKH